MEETIKQDQNKGKSHKDKVLKSLKKKPNFKKLKKEAEKKFLLRKVIERTFLGGVEQGHFVCGNNDNINGPIPIRVGDKVRLTENPSFTGAVEYLEFTVATVPSGTINSALTFTVEESVSGADNEYQYYAVSIQTPGLCRNFSQKGGFMTWMNSGSEFVASKRENIVFVWFSHRSYKLVSPTSFSDSGDGHSS